MAARRRWTHAETAAAVLLYCQTPFGRMHKSNPDVVGLANRIGRTPSSVALKLTNFASLDPTLSQAGMVHTSKLDRDVWNEFFSDPDQFVASSLALQEYGDVGLQLEPAFAGVSDIVGEDVRAEATRRRGQDFFRRSVLASYDNACCVTGLRVPQLLNASHIVPWSTDRRRRTDPTNGLCLNALHDRAFDRGLIAFDDGFRLMLSNRVRGQVSSLFDAYEGKTIRMPSRFMPSPEAVKFHRENIFDR